MLRDAERCEKFRVMRENFRWRVAAVKIAEQAGDSFDNKRIRIAIKATLFISGFCDEPKFGETAGNQIFFDAQFWRERRTFFCFFNEKREPILTVFQSTKLRGDFSLFFREVHGAELFLIGLAWRFFRLLRRT
jgi:hypothetical protein